MQAVYLTPRSTFPGALPSNMLFGAIVRSMAELGYDPGPFLAAFDEGPPVIISSAFPFADKQERVHYFPMPVVPPSPGTREASFETLKELRKVRFVEHRLFEDLVTGRLSIEALVHGWGRDYHMNPVSGILATSRERCAPFRGGIELPHNQINRLSTASVQFYHTTGVQYEDGGLFFLMDLADERWRTPIVAALKYLEDRGIGPRASSGQGHFRLEIRDFVLEQPAEASHLVTLSRFLPESLDRFEGDVWYDLTTIRGRTQDGMMKRRVMMLSEGAVFRSLGDPAYGRIAVVRDDPPMIENGVAFPVRYRWAE